MRSSKIKDILKKFIIFYVWLHIFYPLFAQNHLTECTQKLFFNELYILESEREDGKYLAADMNADGFKPYHWQKLSPGKNFKNRMYTLRATFTIAPELKECDVSIFLGPAEYGYNVYINDILITKRGNLVKNRTDPVMSCDSEDLYGNILHYYKENTLAIEAFCERSRYSIGGVYIAGKHIVDSEVFIRNLLNVDFSKVIFFLFIIIGIYFLFIFFMNEKKAEKYLLFALAAFFYALSPVNLSFYNNFADGLLLMKLSRIGFSLCTAFLTLFILEFTQIYHLKVKYKLLIIIPALTCSVITLFLKSGFEVNSFFSTIVTTFYIVPTEIINITVLAISFFRKKRKNSLYILLGQVEILLPTLHDIYFLNQFRWPYFWLTPYGFSVLILFIFLLLSKEQADIQKKLEKLSHILKNKNERLLRIDKLKDEFLANTSHELKTPLNGIVGLSHSLYEGSCGRINNNQKQILNMIIHSGKRLSRLINDILDFSKLKNGDISLEKGPVFIKEVTNIVVALLTPLAQKKSICIENTIPENIPPVFGDENRIEQILNNLIGNSIKFTEKGKIVICASVIKSIFVEISIIDSGTGIQKDTLRYIFKPFEQGDISISKKHKGTGLGLAITKNLIELHGGNLKVESEPGKGTRCYFTLPLHKGISGKAKTNIIRLIPGESDEDIKHVSNFNKPGKSPSDMVHVLIADDEAINRQVLINYLSVTKKYELSIASNGREVLDIFHNHSRVKPDIILLDLMMPGLTGQDVCMELRKKYPKNILPIIIVTARNRISDMVEAFNFGVNDYLPKPVLKEELLSRLQLQCDILMLRKKENEVRNQLYQADRLITIGTSISEVSHEINNFNSVINTNAKLLYRRFTYIKPIIDEYYKSAGDFIVGGNNYSDIKDGYSGIYKRILRNSERIKTLVQTIKTFARKESMYQETVKIGKVISEALNLCKLKAKNAHVTIIYKSGNAIPDTFGHHQFLTQAFTNLINNGIEAADKESAFVQINTQYDNNSGQIIITIEDNGCGIEKENIEKILTPFFTSKADRGGTGLGLSIVLKIIQSHGGIIHFDSKKGIGTTVMVSLPILT